MGIIYLIRACIQLELSSSILLIRKAYFTSPTKGGIFISVQFLFLLGPLAQECPTHYLVTTMTTEPEDGDPLQELPRPWEAL